jgi:long-chain acyl-CoA synthetase
MSYDEAVAAMTGPGGPFEIIEAEVLGRVQRVFTSTPPSLRALFDTMRLRPDETSLVYEDERLTYPDLVARIDATASLLVEHYGVTRGDRVAIDMRNYPEWIEAFAAITSIGAVAVSLNAWWTGPEIEYGLLDSGARVVFLDRERVERVGDRLEGLGIRAIVVRHEGPLPDGCDHLDDVLVPGAAMPEVEIDPDDDATILYTSGTTGRPKGAVSTHRAVLSALMAYACRSFVEMLRTDPAPKGAPPKPPSTFILVVPLFHVTGCVPVMLGSVLGGYKLVMMRKWDAGRALELIEREKVTNFVGVPTMAGDLLTHPDLATRDVSSLANLGGGGAPMAPDLVRRIDDTFSGATRPQLGYGMTETSGYGPGNTGPDYVAKPSSTGRAIPIMQVRVIDADGAELPAGKVGEVLLSGPMIIRGYWNRPEATAEAIVDGWLHTGDLGYLDDEGFLFLVDRAKDMVLRGGENVYCAEVEAAIYEHPAVHEAAVFGTPDERLGEEVAAAVLARSGDTIDVEQLTAFLEERIAKFMVPTRWFVRDEPLPRGATGKILKREIRDEVLDTAG